MDNWNYIKQYIEPDGSLIDIFINDFNKEKWILLIDWLYKQKNIIQINYYDSKLDKNYSKLQKNLYKIINYPEFYMHINLKFDNLELVIHYFIEDECEIDINREAIQTEFEFERLTKIIKMICEVTNSNYYKICPEGSKDFIIYDRKIG